MGNVVGREMNDIELFWKADRDIRTFGLMVNIDYEENRFSYLSRFLYTEKLSTALIEKDIRVALEVMKCAGKYGVPYLYIQCRQWILEHFVEHFNSRKNVETDGLPYLRLVNDAT